jgi:hypothetical protein
MLDTDNGKSTTCLKFFGCFLIYFFAVFDKTRIILENSETPTKKSHKKNIFKKRSNTIDPLVQKIQLNEHCKFPYYVMFATMDMPIRVE